MSAFLKNMYHSLILRLMQSDFYYWAVMKVVPYVRFSTYYTSLRGWRYLRGYKTIENGDIICVIDTKKLTTYLIPGMFSHAALVVEKGAEWEISEMTHRNYTKSTFFDICKEADRVVVLRCNDWDLDYIKNTVIPNARAMDGAKYDVSFELGVKMLYCSELVYLSDSERRLKVDLSDLIGLGQPYISPDGLYYAKNVTVVWDSCQEIPMPGYW